jgi:hypothetical protein
MPGYFTNLLVLITFKPLKRHVSSSDPYGEINIDTTIYDSSHQLQSLRSIL